MALTGANPFGRYFTNTMFYCIIGDGRRDALVLLIAYGFARLRAPGKDCSVHAGAGDDDAAGLGHADPAVHHVRQARLAQQLQAADRAAFLRQRLPDLPAAPVLSRPAEGLRGGRADRRRELLRIWARIILPLSLPALGAVAILSFMFHYQDFHGPLIYINDQLKYPLSLGLAAVPGAVRRHGLQPADGSLAGDDYPADLIVFFVAQRYFIQGIVVSGVKG